jgi:methionyl-tRNA formyltransferase
MAQKLLIITNGGRVWKQLVARPASVVGQKNITCRTFSPTTHPAAADAISDVDRLIGQLKPNALFSIQFPWILPKHILDSVPLCVNLHTAPLPHYGGYDGVIHALDEDALQFGSTLHLMEPAVDAGPIIKHTLWPIWQETTAPELLDRSTRDAAMLAEWFIGNWLKGQRFDAKKQDPEKVRVLRRASPERRKHYFDQE